MQTTLLTRIAHQIQTHLQTINRHIRAFKAGFQHLDHHPIQFESLENRHLLSAVSFDESLHGDLSADAANNPTLTLDLGQNTITGSISHLTDAQDQFTINLLDGQSITSVTLQTTSTSSPFGIADIMITGNSLLEHAFATTGTQVITDTGFSISSPTLPIDGNWSDTITVMANFAFPNAQYELILTVEETPITNTSPVGMNDQVTVNEDDGPLTIDVLLNDDNLDDPTVEILGDASANTNFTLNDDGTITFNTNGDFDTLSEDESTTREITYRVTNQSGLSDTATLTVNILGQNDAPILVNQPDDISIKQGDTSSPIDLSTIFNDIDTNDTLRYLISTEDPDLISTQIVNGRLTVTTSSTLTGTATLKISAIDNNGATMTTTMNVTVQPQTQTLNDQLMSLKDSLKEMKKDGAISNRYFKNLSKTIDRAMKRFDRGNFFAGIRQLYVLKFKVHILDCRNKISHDDAKNLNSMANESIKTAFKQALENHKHRCWRRFR